MLSIFSLAVKLLGPVASATTIYKFVGMQYRAYRRRKTQASILQADFNKVRNGYKRGRLEKITHKVASMDRFHLSPGTFVAEICMLYSVAALQAVCFLLILIPAEGDFIVRRLSSVRTVYHFSNSPIWNVLSLLISLGFLVFCIVQALAISENNAHYERNRERLMSEITAIIEQECHTNKAHARASAESMVKAWRSPAKPQDHPNTIPAMS